MLVPLSANMTETPAPFGITVGGTVKLTDFLEVPLIDMPPKSMICRVGSN